MGVSVLSTDSQNSGHKPVSLLLHFCYRDCQYKKVNNLANSDKDILWISLGWSTNRFQKDVKQRVILAFKTRIIAVKSRFYSDFLFFIHIRLTAKLYLLIVIIRSFSATEIATQKQALKKM